MGVTFDFLYCSNPERTLVAMHTGRIAPFVLSIDGRLDRERALLVFADHLDGLAALARESARC